jgi:hypothetical protein
MRPEKMGWAVYQRTDAKRAGATIPPTSSKSPARRSPTDARRANCTRHFRRDERPVAWTAAMTYDPRTIAFAAEILYPPQNLRADQVQSVHNTLYRQPQFGYQNFQVAPDGIHLSNLPQAPGQISMATFAWDRLVLREELRGTTVDDFAARLVQVATIAFQTLGVTVTLAQQFVVRSLIAPRSFRDGRDFLGQRLMAPGTTAWQAFDRPLQSLGARLVFPPHEKSQATYHLRIETWPQDPRSIWLENTGGHTSALPAAELPRLAEHLHATYGFLCGPVCEFLGALDRP